MKLIDSVKQNRNDKEENKVGMEIKNKKNI